MKLKQHNAITLRLEISEIDMAPSTLVALLVLAVLVFRRQFGLGRHGSRSSGTSSSQNNRNREGY